MATTLGPIRYRQPPAGGEDFRALSQGVGVLSDTFQSIYTDSLLNKSLDELDSNVEDVLGSAEDSTFGPDGIQSEQDLSAQQFADQYNRLREGIKNSTGSTRARMILQARQVLNRQIEEHPSFRDQLIRQFNNYMSTSPELQQAAMMDAKRQQDTYGQDYVDRITEESYGDFIEGGLGISEDVPIGSLEWAEQYKAQKSKRVALDSVLEELAMAKAMGELNGPQALQITTRLLKAEYGVLQGLFTDTINQLEQVQSQRVEGKLKPNDQEAWNQVTKPALVQKLDLFIANMGRFDDVWLNTPEAMRDTASYNVFKSALNDAQSDAIRVRDSIANDDFDVIEQMKQHRYMAGSRLVENIPLFNNMVNVMEINGGLFTAMRDAGITNELRAFQAGTEGAVADAAQQLFDSFMGASNDGATDQAKTEQEYKDQRRKGKAKAGRNPSTTLAIQDANENINTLAQTVGQVDMSPVLARQGLTTFGANMDELNNGKEHLWDRRDKRQIRETLGDPSLSNLFYGAVKHEVPGLNPEAERLIKFWQNDGDDDLDSFEAWFNELREQAAETLPELPYAGNLLELVRPVEFQGVQNKGKVELIIDEGKVKEAVRARIVQQGRDLSTLPQETTTALRQVRARAQAMSKDMSTFLNARHNMNILTNRQTGPDYLDAYFDSQYGLDLIFPFDENIVPK